MRNNPYISKAGKEFHDTLSAVATDDMANFHAVKTVDISENIMLLPSSSTTIIESAESIFRVISLKKDMFIFGGTISELRLSKGQYSLSQVSPDAFRSRIEGYDKPLMSYVMYKDKLVLQQKLCSTESAKALLASLPAIKLLPHVRVVTSCQILTSNLDVLGKGYHSHCGGILVTSGGQPEEVDVSDAVTSLVGLLDDNQFVTPSDKSRALSMMILPMMKMGGFIASPCPMDVAEANESQSGKTYRQKVIAAIYNETPVVVTMKKGGVGSVDESIASALATGRPFIQLDNFRGNLDSPMLEAVITTPESVSVRVPRATEQIIDASAVSFQLSSNGVNTTSDMANRSCISRIRKQANKKWKKWGEGDLLAHVKAHQNYYISCVMSVIKSWAELGKKMTDTTEHDMREWAQIMDWIVRFIFNSAPLLDGHNAIQDQVSNPNMTWLREVCIAAERDDKLGFRLLAHNIVELCEHEGIEYPNKRKYHEDDSAYKYVGVVMGKLFNKENILIIDSYEITRTEGEIYNENSRRHLMSKYYEINNLSQ